MVNEHTGKSPEGAPHVTCPLTGRSVLRNSEIGLAIRLGHHADLPALWRRYDYAGARQRACTDRQYVADVLAAHAARNGREYRRAV
jgi:hypothetical protein